MGSSSKILVYATTTLVFLTGCKKAEIFKNRGWPCDVQTTRILGRAYHLSNPLSEPKKLAEHISQNKAYFAKKGMAIRCAKELGNRLVTDAFSTFSQEDYNKAYESALNMGATVEHARHVVSSLNNDSLNAKTMGEELLWLAKVLPRAADGNWRPFQTTGTKFRNHIRAIKPYLDADYSAGQKPDPRLGADYFARQTPDPRIDQFGPLAEEQIVMLSIMFGISR